MFNLNKFSAYKIKDLYHGTNLKVVPEILKNGFKWVSNYFTSDLDLATRYAMWEDRGKGHGELFAVLSVSMSGKKRVRKLQ